MRKTMPWLMVLIVWHQDDVVEMSLVVNGGRQIQVLHEFPVRSVFCKASFRYHQYLLVRGY